jgi:hypothetical protein
VGEDARAFLKSLDAQPESDVRSLIDGKQLGRRTQLAQIWLDFQKKIREEADDEDALQRINRGIEGAGRKPIDASAKLPFLSRLRNVIRG